MNYLSHGLVFLVFAWAVAQTHGQTLYETSFESSEGYDSNVQLGGQLGWETRGLAPESVGVTEGGQMFMGGLRSPVPGNPSVSSRKALLERFVPFAPDASSKVVSFRTTLSIHHDNPGAADSFFLLFANQGGFPLFSLFFFTPQRAIAFNNGLTVLQLSEAKYESDRVFVVEATLDFENDRWSATIDDEVIAQNQPLTVSAPEGNLGSFNMAWQSDRLGDLDGPNNYLLMNDLTFSAGDQSERFAILSLEPLANSVRLVFESEPSAGYSIESSTDLRQWAKVTTVTGAAAPANQTTVELALIDRNRYYRVTEE